MQVVFNRNYTETIDRGVIHGGFLIETTTIPHTKCVLHEHILEQDHYLMKYLNSAHWPHFTFNPSIFKTEIFDTLGDFESNCFFERKYADKYTSNGYVSCFFDRVSCTHIGKKSWEKIGKNAYNLNDTLQYK